MNKRVILISMVSFVCLTWAALILNSQNRGNAFNADSNLIQVIYKKMKLKVLTFNAGLFELKVFGFPVIKPADYLKERLETMPAEIIKTDADIIGLQEVYMQEHQDYLIDKLKAAYPYNCYERTKSIKVNNGLMIFSKFPLENVSYQPLKVKGPLDERIVAQKGVLSCLIKSNDFGKIIIINIHPTSGGFLHTQDASEIVEMRNNQIGQAYNLSLENNKIPTIILGDFNTGPEIAPDNYRNLLAKNFADSYFEFCKLKGITPQITWDSGISLNKKGTHSKSISQRIDHIYISPKFQNEFVTTNSEVVFKDAVVKTSNESVHISDHYALLSEFTKK